MSVQFLAVLGAGQMGSGIAQVAAAGGHDVTVYDPYPGALQKGLASIRAALARGVERSTLSAAAAEAALARIKTADTLPEAVAQAVLWLIDARMVTGQMIAVDGGQHLAWRTPDIQE